ncbi:MAG TPA: MFS transporter [Mycobacteriales bacterium]|nr:MFS transporter [Mycobacteriales bacterium]
MSTTTESAASDAASAGRAAKRQVHPNLALTVIAAAQLMVVLDATIVNIALPSIHQALHFSPTGLSWVLNAYTLVFGGLLLLGGRTGDLFGRRRMFIIGVSLFAAASLAGGFAQDKGWLLAMRAVQGVGGAIASPTALSLVTSTFPQGPARNRAFGVYAAVSGAGAALGLILGGVLTDLLSWRWVLFVNAPIGLALAITAPYVIAETERRKSGQLDVPGAITSTGGMAALVYGLIHAATSGWGATITLVSFAIAVVLLTSFVVIEARTANPVMPLRLFRNSARVGSYLVMLVLGAAVFAMFYFLTQFVQQVLGYSPLKAGFAFLPVSFVIVVMAQIASRAITKVGAQPMIVSGTIFAGFGLLYLSSLSPTSPYLTHILPAIALIAVGMGLIFVPITLTAVAGVASEDAGIASAMLNVGQQVGGTLGLSALVTVFSTASRHEASSQAGGLPAAALKAQVFTHGADAAFRAGAVFALFGLVAALLLIRVRVGESPSAAGDVPPG